MTRLAEARWESVDGFGVAAGRDGADRSETRGRGIDILDLEQPRDLRDIANLGLTLAEARQLLTRVQQAVVAKPSHGLREFDADITSTEDEQVLGQLVELQRLDVSHKLGRLQTGRVRNDCARAGADDYGVRG